ncbi:L-ascorbate metabolism protein UlaG (beta-lactamase superfamily) [Blastococcus colisei]|uniref:L-ascorbate metabolism protein UlaG (Beta-lactamase superfamily) n=1 Tax=Blastococcus colisei TaxID=1564162 RepID=A0A543P1N3_9ACTN|nr:MBL fold metallo-hydrolase [Blastococcus colisei]TQN37979.1 L-ascorbate metabolism protein UlaG (beta-lactamase superfamily) [Blastococcus colisei]
MTSPVLHFLGHSTVRVEMAGRTVLTDPVLAPTVGLLRRVVSLPDPATWAGVDLVLISHLHGDHLHIPSLRTVGPRTRIVVPRGAGEWLRGRGFPRVDELSAGESLPDGELRITAVRAEHSGHRWGPRSTHGPDTEAIGFLLEGGGSCVYVSGDTGVFQGMGVLRDRDVDVALLPVWGWGPTLGPGHLDPVGAADAAALIRPRIAVPVHWGTLTVAGMTSVPSPLRARMRRLLVDPPHAFATEVAARGLPTRVVVTAPGSAVDLSVAET